MPMIFIAGVGVKEGKVGVKEAAVRVSVLVGKPDAVLVMVGKLVVADGVNVEICLSPG